MNEFIFRGLPSVAMISANKDPVCPAPLHKVPSRSVAFVEWPAELNSRSESPYLKLPLSSPSVERTFKTSPQIFKNEGRGMQSGGVVPDGVLGMCQQWKNPVGIEFGWRWPEQHKSKLHCSFPHKRNFLI